jgi:hypothetical protein
VQIDTKSSHIVELCLQIYMGKYSKFFKLWRRKYKLLVGQLLKDSIDHIVAYIQFVSFPTRIFKFIDSVLIYITRFHSCTVAPNRLSDHNAQYLILKDVSNLDETKGFPCTARLIFKDSISYFQELLNSETWVNIYHCDDVNYIFNLL